MFCLQKIIYLFSFLYTSTSQVKNYLHKKIETPAIAFCGYLQLKSYLTLSFSPHTFLLPFLMGRVLNLKFIFISNFICCVAIEYSLYIYIFFCLIEIIVVFNIYKYPKNRGKRVQNLMVLYLHTLQRRSRPVYDTSFWERHTCQSYYL